jgi:hypothetical protein
MASGLMAAPERRIRPHAGMTADPSLIGGRSSCDEKSTGWKLAMPFQSSPMSIIPRDFGINYHLMVIKMLN